ncbi:hypothetical protein Pcinc_005997 [Petrolisthes cinctipes]|uniref:Uncharacterized protein n=1 Tax=Petrolisthes cinctipes TaxID=88211 RepID=A0AAE1KZJ8_PETCI|nr:hypothetical protein Pcinc_005997 [Petrolisthes cinctipes]
MFKNIISDILNRVLGTYIENLDSSKLNVSIWGGDVELNGLEIKQSALDELDLPVRPVFGHIGRLKLKIPWKDLYNDAWVASVEKVVVVAVPKTSISYDQEREDRLRHEAKMSQLHNAEEARKKHQEVGKDEKPKDGFLEKLLAQVIRNIQIYIRDIHIRYEDCVSCPKSPFAAGVTLHNLSIVSTDEEWTPCLSKNRLIYKLSTLDSLGVYWLPNAALLSLGSYSKEEMLSCLIQQIASQQHIPQGMKYMIGPISSTAKLQMNTKPEEPDDNSNIFVTPRLNLNVVMELLAIGLSRHQYSNIMALLDSLDRLKTSSQFRRYRPASREIKGNAREWWHYAYECKLENIRRVRENWSWEHMRKHCANCRRYKAAYKAKLENQRLSTTQQNDLNECEKILDVFNLVLVRRQAEMEVKREGQLRQEEKKNRGWFGGWFSSSPSKGASDTADKEGNIVKKLEAEMTDDEKKKLYEAIGYSETLPSPDLPVEYVDLKMVFLLHQLVLTISDDIDNGEGGGQQCVAKASLQHVSAEFEKRSGADAIKVISCMKGFLVEGYGGPDPAAQTPQLVTSEGAASSEPLLNVLFETNPLDKTCDQRLKVSSQPLHIVYHAKTIHHIASVFHPPEDVSLQQLQAAALNQFEVVKERSVAGLQAVAENHSFLDLNVAFAASNIIVPEYGTYKEGGSAVIVTLGSVLMRSVPRDRSATVATISSSHTHEETVELMRTSSYDHFTIELVNIQALVSLSGEDWRQKLCDCGEAGSELHLLRPTTLHLDLYKCLIIDDPNLARLKVDISLPNVALNVADERLLQLVYIAHSIPKDSSSPATTSENAFPQVGEDDVVGMGMEDIALVRLENTQLRPGTPKDTSQQTPQFTNVLLKFKIKEISVDLHRACGSGVYQPLLHVAALAPSITFTQRTFDLKARVILGGVLVQHLDGEGREFRLLSTPLAEGSDKDLLDLQFTQVNPKSPDFVEQHESTAQLIHVVVTDMRAHLEQSAILSILAFVEQVNVKLAELTPEEELTVEKSPEQPEDTTSRTKTSQKQADSSSKKKSKSETREILKTKVLASHKKQSKMEVTALRIKAELRQVSLVIGFRSRKVAQVDVAGVEVKVTQKGEVTTIRSCLKDFTVIDPAPAAIHPKIVEVGEAEALEAEVALYGSDPEDNQYLNMQHVDTSVSLTFGGARVVFLNKFVSDVLNWVDKFQSAKAAVASVGVAAAAAAQASLQDAYDKCSRISLALTLRAPVILIPQDSGSLSGLLVDLGKITINNKFKMGQERNELGYPSIYDMIMLNLQDVKLSRVELTESGSRAQEHILLQPITLDISICRNLTISWNKQQPELEVAAKLKPIEMSLSDEDMKVALTVLQDNLGEQADQSSSAMATDHIVTTDVEREREVEQELAAHGHIFTKVHFAFTIEAVTLSLLSVGTQSTMMPSTVSETNTLTGDIKTCPTPTSLSTTTSAPSGLARVLSQHSVQPATAATAPVTPQDTVHGDSFPVDVSEADSSPATSSTPVFTESPSRKLGDQESMSGTGGTWTKEKQPLAEVSLVLVTLKGELKSDATLAANLVLFDFILQDTRPGHEKHITRMLERKAQGGKKGMLDLTFKQGPAADKFVDVRISSFVMVLHLPFLLRLQQFASNLPQQPDSSQASPPSTAVAKNKSVAKSKEQTSSDDSVMMTVRVKVEQPDIILVEDLSTHDTSCIILHAEASCNLRMVPKQQNLSASITNVQMYTCIFNPEKRQRTLSQILEQCDVLLIYSVTSEHGGHIDLKVTRMNFRVAIGTIELLSSIAAAVSSGEADEGQGKQGKQEGIEFTEDFSRLWKARDLDQEEFSFLAVDDAEEAFPEEASIIEKRKGSSGEEGPQGEVMVVDVESVLITLEAGSYTSPIPLLKLQAALDATGFRSQKLTMEGSISLEVAYYNPRLAAWEPLLEPVENPNAGSTSPEHHQPWTLNFQLSHDMSSGEDSGRQSLVATPVASPDSDEVDNEIYPTQKPVTVINLTAKDPLEVTVTNTFMDVSSSLTKAFAEAYKRLEAGTRGPRAPYRVINRTGRDVKVAVRKSGFQVAGEGGEEVEDVTVEPDAEVELFEVRVAPTKHRRVASLVAVCQTVHDRNIELKIPTLECTITIPVARADKRYFEIENKKAGEKWGMVASISVESGCKVVTLSSCVQVSNHLDVPVEVYYMTPRGNEVESVVTLAKDQSALLPLHAIYTPTAELFFCVEGHNVCIMPLVWRTLQNNPGQVQELHCPPRDLQQVHSAPFIIAATGEVEQILWGETTRRTMMSCLYRIHLRPRLVLHNLLPVPLCLDPPGTMSESVLMPGASLHLTKAQPGAMYLELKVLDYLSRDWVCGKAIESVPPNLSVWTFESRGDVVGGPLYLDLGMLASDSPSTLALSLYCPFWMVNKTGLMLTYRGDAPNNIVVHEEDNKQPILFSFKSKAFFGKKKATVKVEDSEWSSKFSLDVVGNSGSVLCKGHERSYQVGVDIKLGNSGLTKLVIFSPFYRIMNKAPYALEVVEVGVPQAEWFTVLSDMCIGWWPMTSERRVRIRVKGTQEATPPLPYDCPLSTLLPLSNKYGGVRCEVSVSDGGTVVCLDQCSSTAVTALLINHLPSTTVSLWQHGIDNKKLILKPQTVMPYTWGDPGGTLSMVWTTGEGKPTRHMLDRDDQGVLGKAGDNDLHWVVFLSNNQRCLLFTDSPSVAMSAVNAVEFERFQQDITVSLNSIGLSLVDDSTRREVAYISMASSGVVWEHRKMRGKKQRPFTEAQTEQLEKAYQLYQGQLRVASDLATVKHQQVICRNLEVDFNLMESLKPFHRIIRRTFQPGVWLQLKVSEHQRLTHMKVNSVQVDNQMCDVLFPVVLARVPPPRSVMAETVAKPFCEISVVQRVTSPVFTQFRYLAVLIQEFHVQVELPFIFTIIEVLTPPSDSPQDSAAANLYSKEKYEKDMEEVQGSLTSTVAQQIAGGRRDYYQHLHLSPIKMHLSFSLACTDSGTNNTPVGGQVIHLFLQSVGVPLSEVQGIVFRLGYFERQNQWLSQAQVMQEVVGHYRSQVIRQLYVLVLGLDVIGNPLGLVVGLTKGVEDLFYEPFQGAIEGPGEFAEGVLLGVGSFLGKTVGGAAGAVSRITGTLGKGMAALTMDEEYQKRRREAMHRKPADGLETIARGGKGIVSGVFEGVTGVVTKPIEGARDDGFGGFVVGMGKGVMGLVTRPASGVIDFASESFDAVVRATDSTEEVARRRPARFIGRDGVVKPYVQHLAKGAKILRELEKGRYAKTDIYVAHVYIMASRAVLLATDKRIMQVVRNDILGHLKVDWVYSYEELSQPPSLTPKGMRISIKQEKKRVLGMFGGGDNSKVVLMTSEEQAKWFLAEVSKMFPK